MKYSKLFALFSICSIVFSHNTKADDYQPLEFDTIKEKMEQPEYAQDILPNDFTYLSQFLQYGHDTHQTKRNVYIRSVLSIFSKLLGGSQYVNAYAFSNMLTDLPHQLKPYFVPYKAQEFLSRAHLDSDMYDRFKEAVYNILYMQLSSQYEFFKSEPYQFLSELTQQIVDVTQEEMDTERTRYALMRFLEISINKLIWCPDEQDKIWDNVKKISHQLEELMEQNIIEDPNDLDDLFWTLLHRFNFFLAVSAPHLDPSFYDEIKNDVTNKQLLLLELDEPDICIQTKADCLSRMLMQAEAKSRAYQKGIITG